LSTSCRSQKEATTTTEYVYVDRCTIDTIVKVEADTASLMALIECDSLGNALISQLETLQGQRVNVAPQIIYRNIVDESGKIRRTAYFSVVALADSLQTEISMLQEHIRQMEQNQESIEPTTSPIRAFLWGLLAGAVATIVLIIFFKK